MDSICLLPGAIAELTAATIDSRRLAHNDRYGLMAAMLSETLSDDERSAIDRLLRAIRRRKIAIS
ncbi:MAG: hypothetical protein AAGF01_02090 [Cyanobacteria bacterium P01_G01_bin.38]